MRPHVVLVLCDALTLNDVHNSAYPHLKHLAETGATGLMNCVVAGPKTPAAVTLTLAVGQHAPAEPTDAQAANPWELVPGDPGTVREVYERRTGWPGPPAAHKDLVDTPVLHLGIAGLARRDLDTARLGAALAQATPPVRTLVLGNADIGGVWGRQAALLTVDARGVGRGLFIPRSGPNGVPDSFFAYRDSGDFVVIEMGDMARVEARRGPLSPPAFNAARAEALEQLDRLIGRLTESGAIPGSDILLISPTPPADSAGPWSHLTPILAAGPDFPPGLLTSPTTRTSGLVANVDLAPTLLTLFQAPVPATMEGRPMRSAAAATGDAVLARLDQTANLNDRATVPLMLGLGAFCFLLTLAGLVARKLGGIHCARRLAPGLVFTQNLPAGLLLATVWLPSTILGYGLDIAAWMAGLTAACYALARLLRLAPPVACALLTLALVAADTLAGQPLLKLSLLSNYPLSGIRYYGVGNEYLGVMLGFALAGGFAWLDGRRLPYPPGGQGRAARGALAAIWLGLLLLLGWPGLGANAGSLIATGAGFGVGAALLLGRQPTVRLGIACALAGLALAFVFGALDAALAARASSHLGATLQAASGGRGPGYLAAIAARKVAMNLRILGTPWLLLPAAAVLLTVLGARFLVGAAVRESLRRRPWTARGLAAALAAALAALLFKDSGVVTATFLAGSVCVIVLYYALTDLTLEAP